jgi:TonB family protein
MLLSGSNFMAPREKFGKLVLLEESDVTGLGQEYRAAKLGPAGLEKIVTILRLGAPISGNAEIARSLMDQAKVSAQLQNPHILKIFGIGKVDQTYYISYEHTEGKSLLAILERCRQEIFPLQIEHTLLIASKVCSALEYAHGRKSETGRYYHGFLTPSSILVSYEGEIRVKGFGYWPSRVKEILGPDELRYLAPEQRSGGGEPASDLYALGAILFEALTGAPAAAGNEADQIRNARLVSPQGDDDSIPAPVAEILRKSLTGDPAVRYPDAQDMRKDLDTLLFSGDFSPTTFNLAFFMHSLYREDIEQEAKRLKEDREASYLEFLTEDAGRSAPPVRPAATVPPSARTEPLDARAIAARIPPPVVPATPASSPPLAAVSAARPTHDDAPHGMTAKEAAAGFTFHKEEKKAKRSSLAVPLLLALALGGSGAAYYVFVMQPKTKPAQPPTAAPATLSVETLAAQARIKELEDRLKALEEEKAQAATKAADEAKKTVEAQAAAKGQAVDPATMERAQEEARRKAKAEQEKRQLEEQRRLEEQKKAEEARVAEEKRRADEQAKAKAEAAAAALAAAAAAATPPPTEAPSVAPIKPGTLVSLNDPGVVAPVVDREPQLAYPPIALRQRVDGVVELNVLVDEKGNVADVAVVTAAGGRAGLTEAAAENVKRRHYRPAVKDGVPVRVWVAVRVRFELPK